MFNFLNPWVLVGALAALMGSFLSGMYVEHGRYMSFVAAVDTQGKLAEERRALKIEQDKRLKEEIDAAHKKQVAELSVAAGALRDQLRNARTRRSIVPAAPARPAGHPADANGGPERVCFDREKLHAGVDRSLERFEQRLSALVQRGAGAMIDLNTCAAWAKELAAQRPRAEALDLTKSPL